MINRDRLMDEADALTVAEYLGMEVVKKGSNYYIPCPGHEKRLGKPDTTIGNCVLTQKGYRCFACNKFVNIIDMVMEYEDCSYPQALSTIAESLGGVALFDNKNRNAKKIEKLPLSNEDFELIGIKNYKNKTLPIMNVSIQYPDISEFDTQYIIKKLDEEYHVYKKGGKDIRQLFRENKKSFNLLVLEKSKEAMDKYENIINNYCSRTSKKANVIFNLFEEDGYIDDEIYLGLKHAFQKKFWRAKEIYEQFSEEIHTK